MAKITKRAQFTVEDLDTKSRLDVYLSNQRAELTRNVIAQAQLWLNGNAAKKGNLVQNGDELEIEETLTVFEGLTTQAVEFPILYEDESIVVINKPQGLVVHPAAGNWDHTLANGLLYRYGDSILSVQEEGVEGVRPGIVHRLDKETSGVLVVALTQHAQITLNEQFKERTTTKIYIALVDGVLKERSGKITAHIRRNPNDRKKMAICASDEGRSALTEYTLLKQFKTCALVRITLHTGRTHQIRVHFASIGHPVVGDELYGKTVDQGMMLHAIELGLIHPKSGKPCTFKAPLPERFLSYVRLGLNKNSD